MCRPMFWFCVCALWACGAWSSIVLAGEDSASPADAASHARRAIALLAEGELDEAIAACGEAIRLKPNGYAAHVCRGAAWLEKGQYDQAIRDYTRAISLSPRNAYAALTGRGIAWRRKGECARAIADYHQALRLNPVHGAEAYNALAWAQATFPDARCRNGQDAVANARLACRETGWMNPYYLGTLAAAQAEAGDFAEAVRWQERALELIGDDDAAARHRLELYQAGKPYRDQPAQVASSSQPPREASR